ncbi:hypothetical protein GCM10027093_12910 [Paraburkholderia jirisanensis]
MNANIPCEEICGKLGFGYERLDADGGAIMALDTPFGFSDGSPFVIYIEHLTGGTVRFFDSGETLFHAMGRGIRSFHSRKYQSIKALLSKHGASIDESGDIQVFHPEHQMAIGFARYISALIAVADWEDENAGVDLADKETRLVHEARMYLTALHSAMPAEKSNFKARGLSGREYGFDLVQGDAQIDAISSHANAAASELYKLVDLRGKALTADTKIIVIIDDRSSINQAEQEIAVLGQYADTWAMRKLIHAATGGTQH